MRHPAVFSSVLVLLPPLLVHCAPADPVEPMPAAAPLERTVPAPEPRSGHRDLVMTSAFCGKCHTAAFAEHAQNTHGRAFTDEEVRLATGRFSQTDCIRCHTPRPVFETGIGLNPLRRFHDLEEGNSCMTCHFKQGVDYAKFEGGKECVGAFDDRVGTVEACASCHRNHGTPYQWEKAITGKLAGNTCVDCHMKTVSRPIAEGGPVREVHLHEFPASRSEEQLRRAYRYEAAIEGNEAVIKVTNKGAGHHFPTELKQRSVESVVIVRDAEGKEIARSRMVFRDPYKRPYGLTLPVNTQILPGETREHRVPIGIADGSVECQLHYKLYYPIEDFHPDLARLLESKQLVFAGIEPSTKPVESAPDVRVRTPETLSPEQASVANLSDFAHPPIGKVEVEIPTGDDPESIRKLVELLQFPVPEAARKATGRLAAIGEKAVPALMGALGSWDNKTWNAAMKALAKIGTPALPAILKGLESDELYTRVHSRELLVQIGWLGGDEKGEAALAAGLKSDNAVDRATAAECLGSLGLGSSIPLLRPLLDDVDPDTVRNAALGLARLNDRESVPAIEAALAAATFPETKADLAFALAKLGSVSGLGTLLDQLDYPDDLIREAAFEKFFAVTAMHLGYEPLAPRPDRLAALADLRSRFATTGGEGWLRTPPKVDPARHSAAVALVDALGDPEMTEATDDARVEQLIAMGDAAVPALVYGLKYAPGFDEKRRRLCACLSDIGSADGAPALQYALRDPVVSVAAWACFALGNVRDPETLPALRRFQDRLLTLKANDAIPAEAGTADSLLAVAAQARLRLGDERAKQDLVALLLSADSDARGTAIAALEEKYGDRRGYDPAAEAAVRRKAVEAWTD